MQSSGLTGTHAAAELLGTDPVPWLLASAEPYTRWVTRTGILGEAHDAPDVAKDHQALLEDPGIRDLIDTLPAWDAITTAPDHHSPAFLPNRLNLLADLGVQGGDDVRIESLIDALLAHQDRHGRFTPVEANGGRPKPDSGAVLCDTNVIAYVALRFGRGDDERVGSALGRMRSDLAATPQGRAWQCVPERRPLFSGVFSKADVCPQVTLEGLRALSYLHGSGERPSWLLEAARTPLAVWRRRTAERPYGFGHGYQFKSVKWPNFWYDVLWALETVGRYPEIWSGPRSTAEDRRSAAELAACLIAYNFDDDGRVTPRRVYPGFERFSFGRKTAPSPFATARCLTTLLRFSELAEEIAGVDVGALPGSLGGTGAPVVPRRTIPACPVPTRVPTFPPARAVTRVLARHHLGMVWEPASIDTVVGDIVGVQATSPEIPYLALHARLPETRIEDLDAALYERRSLVRIRCMRGMVFVVRTDLLPIVFSATNAAVSRYARTYAAFRGVKGAAYERVAEQVLALLEERGPLTTAEIRGELDVPLDVAATVSLMCAEGRLLRDRPVAGWLDRRTTYVPLADALPGIRLDSIRPDDADIALVRAHIRAFGPVLAEDTSWWTGLGRKRTARALRALGDEIVTVRLTDVEGDFLVHAADVDELAATGAAPSPAVALLPALDPLVSGYARRGRFVDDAHRPYIFDQASRATSVVLVDGRIAGVWDVATEPETEIRVHLLGEGPPSWREAIEAHAAAAGRFRFGADVPVRWVATMQPLVDRTQGAVFKPLR